MLQRFKQTFLIILLFFILLFLLSSAWMIYDYTCYINCNNPSETYSNKLPHFLLYLIGYGEIETGNESIKLIVTFLGLFVLTLLSSVLTISLFDWNNKISLSQIIILFDPNHRKRGVIDLGTRSRDLYDVKITLQLTSNSISYEDQQTISYIPKKTRMPLYFDAELGSVLYRYIYDSVALSKDNAVLVCLISYVDSKNGQTFTECKKYHCNNDPKTNNTLFYNSNNKWQYGDILKALPKKTISNNIIMADKILSEFNLNYSFDFSAAIPLRATIDRTDDAGSICGIINFSNELRNPENFQMIVFRNPLCGDWRIFHDYSCELSFDAFVEGGITLLFEAKKTDKSTFLPVPAFPTMDKWQHYCVNFNSINRDDLKSIDELCFTVMDNCESRNGIIIIKNLSISYVGQFNSSQTNEGYIEP